MYRCTWHRHDRHRDRPQRRRQDDAARGAHGAAAGARRHPLLRRRGLAAGPSRSASRRGLVLVPEKRELFAAMTVEDNLLLGALRTRGAASAAMAHRSTTSTRGFRAWRSAATQLAGTLSGGERQMLALGRALMAQPKLLMLDEPWLGLAPLIVREIFAIIADAAHDRRVDPAGRAERACRAAGRRLRLRARDRRDWRSKDRAHRSPRIRAWRKHTLDRPARAIVAHDRNEPISPVVATGVVQCRLKRRRCVPTCIGSHVR